MLAHLSEYVQWRKVRWSVEDSVERLRCFGVKWKRATVTNMKKGEGVRNGGEGVRH